MSNICLKVTIEKKRRTWGAPNQFFGSSNSGELSNTWGVPTQADIVEFSNFLLQLKNQRFWSKTPCGFSNIFNLKGINVLKSNSPCFLLNKNVNFNKNETESKI